MARDVLWSAVADRLRDPRSYWLHTTGAGGAPHVAPVWGVELDGVLYFYSERRTRKARNIAADPRVVVNLENAEDVVIVHGRADDLGAPAEHSEVLAAFEDKYSAPGDAQYLPSNDPAFDVLWALVPESAQMWELANYEASQRRWKA
ncbi:pyridoxamine 5'-phosphate oxidase family protein [Streptomyces sp. NPDC005408]|uniref:pyridoxamine 5'-phosphate oxidase family protein n=1 Tax=Streptomyces sp. NPDC005408 TaxID=3155341 RepID=UPI0033AF7DDA